MKKIVSIIIIVSLTSLIFSGCSFKVRLGNLKSDINLDKIKDTSQVESVEDLKKLNDKRYDNICKDLYDDEDTLLSKDDDYLFTIQDIAHIKSRLGVNFKYFRGYKTQAYFYRFKQTTDHITFTYKGTLNKGRCKLIIVSPSLKIVSSIELNGQASADVPITEDGIYYVRLIGDDASGDIEYDAKGNDVIYKFTPESYKEINNTGLYDYE